MIMSSYLSPPRLHVMHVLSMVDLCQFRELSFCGSELCYLLGRMALYVMLYILLCSSVVNESFQNA